MKPSRGVFLGLALGIVLTLLLGVGVLLPVVSGRIPIQSFTSVVGAPICQGANSSGLRFTARTRNTSFAGITELNSGRGVPYRVRANTSSDYDVRGRLLPGNCQVGFTGFCIGEAVPDQSGGDLRDQIWFVLPDNAGLVSGAAVQEFAPGVIGKDPQRCDGDVEPLGRVSATGVRAPGGQLVYTVKAPRAATVGAAFASTPEPSPGTSWAPVGIGTNKGEDTFILPGIEKPQQTSTVVFVACWAGNVPATNTSLSVEVLADGTTRPDPQPETEAERNGSSVACRHGAGGI